MTYRVDIERTALRGIRKVDPTAAARIGSAIDALAEDPRPQGTRALTGPYAGAYRLRISAPGGEYRVIWSVNDKTQVVTIIEAGPREGAY